MKKYIKKEIDLFDHTGDILKALKKGVLITTQKRDKLNAMTISWGKLGIEWHRPIFITYVRGSRFTYEMLKASGEFTININIDGSAAPILAYCGKNSGRDTDKIADMNLTPVPGNSIETPGLAELPLTLECEVIYQQKQDKSAIPEELRKLFYPDDKDDDYHTMFYGEITGAYIIEVISKREDF